MEHVEALYYWIVALCAVIIYGYPAKKLKVIAVTGTSGKTTTAHLIYSILKAANKRVALISSVQTIIGGKTSETGLHVTTPTPFKMQRLLKTAIGVKDEYIVIEASSHGIAQKRMLGTNVFISVITNIAHEHLDWHKTFQAYAKAKISLLANSSIAVINIDDSSYKLINRYKPFKADKITYGIKNNDADFTPYNLPCKTNLPGIYNLYNVMAAGAVTAILGISNKTISQALDKFSGLCGRFENIPNKRGFQIIIDFAHKPNALEALLLTLRKNKKARLIIMFGSAGERDKKKRPMMGEIAGRLADISVITAEDPRSEEVADINKDISFGFQKTAACEVDKDHLIDLENRKKHYYINIPDRREAINTIINRIARKGDIVAFLGKAHEKSMCFRKVEYPWNEHEEINKALAKLS